MLRGRNVDPNSRMFTQTYFVFVENTVTTGFDLCPIALADVHRVELIELGVASKAANGTMKAELSKIGAGGFDAAGTIVKTQSDGADVAADDKWGIERFDPPVEILSDYSAASTDLVTAGFKGTPLGHVKLVLRFAGAASTYSGWVWCTLRIWKIEDLGQGS